MQEIVGHDRAVVALRRAILADNVHHAYLVTGPPRAGKASLAVAFLRSLNCTNPTSPCVLQPETLAGDGPSLGTGVSPCRPCRLIARGTHPDVQVIELAEDRSKISYKEIDQLQSDVSLRPIEARYKGYLILDAERLSETAANQLLKTLEEPPEHVVLVLTAQDPNALLPTIASRCQEIRLAPVSRQVIADELVRRGANVQAAAQLAAMAKGRIGWALEAARNPELLQSRERLFEEFQAALQGTRLERLQIARGLAEQWPARAQLVEETLHLWCDWARDALLLKLGLAHCVAHVDRLDALKAVARQLDRRQLSAAIVATQTARQDLEQNSNARLTLDVALLTLTSGSPTFDFGPASSWQCS